MIIIQSTVEVDGVYYVQHHKDIEPGLVSLYLTAIAEKHAEEHPPTAEQRDKYASGVKAAWEVPR